MNIDKREFAPLLKNFPKGLVALDLETTGLSPLIDKIIEIAAIKVTPEGVETYEQLINPKIPIPELTTDIHGIKDADVANKPSIEDCMPEFKSFIGQLPLLAHNAKFDIGFLVFAHHNIDSTLGKNKVYCSIKASRQAFRDMPNHKLGTLAAELGIPLVNHHRALDDSYASLSIFNKAISGPYYRNVLKESFLFRADEFNSKKFLQLPERLQVLIKKIQTQTLVDIKYKGGSHKGKFRPIKPISLLPMPEGNVLYALCLLSNLHKSFALHKIKEVKELNANEIAERHKELKKLKEENKDKL